MEVNKSVRGMEGRYAAVGYYKAEEIGISDEIENLWNDGEKPMTEKIRVNSETDNRMQ